MTACICRVPSTRPVASDHNCSLVISSPFFSRYLGSRGTEGRKWWGVRGSERGREGAGGGGWGERGRRKKSGRGWFRRYVLAQLQAEELHNDEHADVVLEVRNRLDHIGGTMALFVDVELVLGGVLADEYLLHRDDVFSSSSGYLLGTLCGQLSPVHTTEGSVADELNEDRKGNREGKGD